MMETLQNLPYNCIFAFKGKQFIKFQNTIGGISAFNMKTKRVNRFLPETEVTLVKAHYCKKPSDLK